MSDYDEFKLLVTSIMDNWYGLQVRICFTIKTFCLRIHLFNFAFCRQLFRMAWEVLLSKLRRQSLKLQKKLLTCVFQQVFVYNRIVSNIFFFKLLISEYLFQKLIKLICQGRWKIEWKNFSIQNLKMDRWKRLLKFYIIIRETFYREIKKVFDLTLPPCRTKVV